jgi:hypothetical protein
LAYELQRRWQRHVHQVPFLARVLKLVYPERARGPDERGWGKPTQPLAPADHTW